MDDWKIAIIIAFANIILGLVGQLVKLIILKIRQKWQLQENTTI